MLIPSDPLVRVNEWWNDGETWEEWWQRRWVPFKLEHAAPGNWIEVPEDEEAMSKSVDPYWRRNWRWALYELPDAKPRWIYLFDQPVGRTWSLRTLKPVRKYFALRLGPHMCCMFALAQQGQHSLPQPKTEHGIGIPFIPPLMRERDVERYAARFLHPIFRI